jgi:hypothetical protein
MIEEIRKARRKIEHKEREAHDFITQGTRGSRQFGIDVVI